MCVCGGYGQVNDESWEICLSVTGRRRVELGVAGDSVMLTDPIVAKSGGSF